MAFHVFLPSLGYGDGNPPRSFECQAEESYLEFLSGVEPTSPAKESFSCFRSVEDAGVEDALLIDIRSAKEFQQIRIPQSVNLTPSYLLGTKALKSRPMLIVDKGFNSTDLARLCARAQAEGFADFRILRGGIAAWHAAGKQLKGLPAHFADLHKIEPREFFRELNQSRLSVLSTDTYSEYLEAMSPAAVTVTTLGPGAGLEHQLISHLKRTGSNQGFPTVLLGANEIAEGPVPTLRSVFILDSSPYQLERAYRSHLAVSDKREAVPERFKCGG